MRAENQRIPETVYATDFWLRVGHVLLRSGVRHAGISLPQSFAISANANHRSSSAIWAKVTQYGADGPLGLRAPFSRGRQSRDPL